MIGGDRAHQPDERGVMTDETFGRRFWEQRWAQALRDSPEKLATRPPNAYLLAVVGDLRPGRALDAGCGHGSEAIWLATAGWRVTAVDFSATALDYGRSTARAVGADVAQRVDWVEGDLGSWTPAPGRFDLVSCLYVHVAGSVVDMVRRLGAGVAPGGSLLLVGHRPIDPETGAATPAAGQMQVSVGEAVRALDPEGWQVVVAEERSRAVAGTGVDAVVHAIRHVPSAGVVPAR
jgi:2-polyprenyl-3-methyl-5-hydroxy-6-metoxy-1,4-benzoquinol methylase